MVYKGSKAKLTKWLAPIIQCFINHTEKQSYWEPFCGGCNMIDHIQAKVRIATDNHRYLIALLQNLSKIDSLPDHISREHYNSVRECYNRQSGLYEDWYIGAVGFLSSFNGRFFDGGYATEWNKYDCTRRNLKAQIPHLQGVVFHQGSYLDFKAPSGWVIYCDPPYRGTSQYTKQNGRFDHDVFWRWVRRLSRTNVVLVSEYNAPEDFRVLWEKSTVSCIHRELRDQVTERLFIYGYDWMPSNVQIYLK